MKYHVTWDRKVMELCDLGEIEADSPEEAAFKARLSYAQMARDERQWDRLLGSESVTTVAVATADGQRCWTNPQEVDPHEDQPKLCAGCDAPLPHGSPNLCAMCSADDDYVNRT